MSSDIKNRVLQRFLKYISVDTRSSETSDTFPSTSNQFDLARLLVEELKGLGLQDVTLDENCYVMASLPSNVTKVHPAIGLVAHLDTSPELPGACVNPQIIPSYNGGDIVVNALTGVIIRFDENEQLAKAMGHTLVVTDGTTLLGADDKAGITAIMSTLEYLTSHPEIPHGTIKIAFTPDEEIGKGADRFDLKRFGADFAYTIDGGFIGELNNETFSANAAVITIQGHDIHPGTAKNVMVNAMRIAADIISLLPKDMAPETTENYQGYIHPNHIDASVSEATLRLLLRAFTTEELERQEKLLKSIILKVNDAYPRARIALVVTETYRNMKPVIDNYPQVTQLLENAVRNAGIVPVWKPIRGGTDGSRLSAMGLPTPNIFTGGVNAHSLTEWQSIDALAMVVEVLLNVVK